MVPFRRDDTRQQQGPSRPPPHPAGSPPSEFAYAQAWLSNVDRLTALDGWVIDYNTRRAHSALGGQPPLSRLVSSTT